MKCGLVQNKLGKRRRKDILTLKELVIYKQVYLFLVGGGGKFK